jgi:hypothetical protein
MASTLVCERLPPPPPAVVVVPVAWVCAWVVVVGVGVPGVLSPGDSGPLPEPAASATPVPLPSSRRHASAVATSAADDLRETLHTLDTNVIVGQHGVSAPADPRATGDVAHAAQRSPASGCSIAGVLGGFL